MVARSPARHWSFLELIESVFLAHPAAFRGDRPARWRQGGEARLAALPPHLREDLGLPPLAEPPEVEALRKLKLASSQRG